MSTVTASALTAVIRYIGAEEYMLEQPVWPQRFNNETTFRILLQQSLPTTAGGPLYKEALKTLKTLRDKGLFTGPCPGHVLWTGCFPEFKIIQSQRRSEDRKLILKSHGTASKSGSCMASTLISMSLSIYQRTIQSRARSVTPIDHCSPSITRNLALYARIGQAQQGLCQRG